MARMNWKVDVIVKLLLEINKRQGEEGTEITKEDIESIAVEMGASVGSIRSMLPRIKRALSGEGCLSEAEHHQTITNIRMAYERISSDVLPVMTFTKTDGSTGHKKMGQLSGKTGYNEESNHDFSMMNIDRADYLGAPPKCSSVMEESLNSYDLGKDTPKEEPKTVLGKIVHWFLEKFDNLIMGK